MNKKQELEKLKKNILINLKCPLKDSATNLVFGKGNVNASILFIGEAPGEKEDLSGMPFVGRAGKQLDGLLNGVGLSINDVYIANILKYRPPKNRDPKKEEILNHTPYLIEQIKIIKPKIIATLGNFSTKFILSKFNVDEMKKIEGVSLLHGKIIPLQIDKLNFIICPLYHPAAMLYKPKLKEEIEADFLKMGLFLEKEINHKMPKKEKQMKINL
jgi:uracil-DNA glycosylase